MTMQSEGVRGEGKPEPGGKKPPFEAGAWMSGTLLTIKDGGFGFIYIGPGKPHIFVRVTEVPTHLWHRGAQLRFRVYPPKKGRAWRAQEVEVAGLPTASDLDTLAEEDRARGNYN